MIISDLSNHSETKKTKQKRNKQPANTFNLKRELEKFEAELEDISQEKKINYDQQLQLELEKSELSANLKFFENYLKVLESRDSKEFKSYKEVDSERNDNNINTKDLKDNETANKFKILIDSNTLQNKVIKINNKALEENISFYENPLY